jgi:hypothetical protein
VDDVRIPDKISPEIGWRVWLVVAHGGHDLRLHSAVQAKVAWEPRAELRAECRRLPTPGGFSGAPSTHDAPSEACGTGGGHGCGIYAARTREACLQFLKGAYSPARVAGDSVVHRVLGRVALWGKVLEAERGWRAELAYPADIWVPRLRYASSRAKVSELQAPGLPVESIAAGLAVYGVPVFLNEEDERPLAA